MSGTKNKIPAFADESEEAAFWETHDSADLVDWSAAQSVVLPKLRPTLRSISLRLPEPMLNRLRALANERDIPYQSLIKMILAEHLERAEGRRAAL